MPIRCSYHLKDSTFVLIHQNDTSFFEHLLESMKLGVIPIIISNSVTKPMNLPFGKLINWNKTVIQDNQSLLKVA